MFKRPSPPAAQLLSTAVRYRWPQASRRHGICDHAAPPASPAASVAPARAASERDPRLQRLEAILLLAREPLTSRKLSEFANLADGTEARTLIRQLNRWLDEQGRAFRVEEVAGGYQLLSRPKFAAWLRRLGQVPAETRLSSPAMETLAVIAYRQPVLRADIEAIRGVNCGEILRQLMERDLARICGRSDELGRPYLYATTKKFLQLFGLPNIDKLPRVETMRNVPKTDAPDPDESATADDPSFPTASAVDAANHDPLAHDDANHSNPEKEESQVTDTMTVELNPELATETTSRRRRRGNSIQPTDAESRFLVQDLDDDEIDEDEDDFEEEDDEDEDYFEDDEDDDVDDEDDDVGDDDEFEEEDDEEEEWEEVDDEDDEDWDEEDEEDDLDWDDEDEDEAEEEEDEEEWD